MTSTITGPSDIRDRRWLSDKVEGLRGGMADARDIWTNWTEGRNVSRFAGGKDYGTFIADQLGYRLPLTDAIEAMPNASTRMIGAVAGVGRSTVSRARRGVPSGTPDSPTKVIGADGKAYSAKVIRALPAPTPAQPVEVLEPTPMRDTEMWRRGLRLQVDAFRGRVEASFEFLDDEAVQTAAKAFLDEVEVLADKV